MRNYKIIIYGAFLITALACTSKQEGAVEGIVSPPNSSARITATQDGKAVAAVDVISADGKFRIALAAGKYDIKVTVPSSPLPLSFSGVVVEPAKTTTLPPIDLAMPAGQSVLSGTIVPGGTATKVLLLYEGKERAAVNTTADGKYEFSGLPAGNYTLQANTPGYAADTATVNLSDAQRATQNIRLLYISATDGVDWTAGKIRATGVGMPPKNASNTAVSREMTKRAALVDAQRNLLRIIDQIKVSPDRSLKSFMGDKNYRERIQGFVQGYKIVREQELSSGKREIELELSLTGPSGLSTVIRERQP
jgi:hypothetical protein